MMGKGKNISMFFVLAKVAILFMLILLLLTSILFIYDFKKNYCEKIRSITAI